MLRTKSLSHHFFFFFYLINEDWRRTGANTAITQNQKQAHAYIIDIKTVKTSLCLHLINKKWRKFNLIRNNLQSNLFGVVRLYLQSVVFISSRTFLHCCHCCCCRPRIASPRPPHICYTIMLELNYHFLPLSLGLCLKSIFVLRFPHHHTHTNISQASSIVIASLFSTPNTSTVALTSSSAINIVFTAIYRGTERAQREKQYEIMSSISYRDH